MNLRLSRILRVDGKAVIVAMDHGNFAGPMPGIFDIGKSIELSLIHI